MRAGLSPFAEVICFNSMYMRRVEHEDHATLSQLSWKYSMCQRNFLPWQLGHIMMAAARSRLGVHIESGVSPAT